MKPKSALVVVDVQNDFISGSLAIKNCPAGQNGEEVVPPINTLLGMTKLIIKNISNFNETHCENLNIARRNCCSYQVNYLVDTVPFTMHCYSLDWHPSDHISFIDNVHKRKLSHDSKGRDKKLHFVTSASNVQFVNNLHLLREETQTLFYPLPQVTNPDRCTLYDTVTFEEIEGRPKMDQVLWPAHCVQDSWGAELHQDLKVFGL